MELKLAELRAYAINNRVTINFSDGDPVHLCAVNDRGQLKIVGEDKNFDVEQVFSAAQSFEIVEATTSRVLTREAMSEATSKSKTLKSTPATAHEED
ncbi:MAG TPA: hypothetical protein VKM94_17655 [Blastocatellia bacterium]|nr:hypothetical protein [Blastocatellia bacterium]